METKTRKQISLVKGENAYNVQNNTGTNGTGQMKSIYSTGEPVWDPSTDTVYYNGKFYTLPDYIYYRKHGPQMLNTKLMQSAPGSVSSVPVFDQDSDMVTCYGKQYTLSEYISLRKAIIQFKNEQLNQTKISPADPPKDNDRNVKNILFYTVAYILIMIILALCMK